jgi:hypothetical protein
MYQTDDNRTSHAHIWTTNVRTPAQCPSSLTHITYRLSPVYHPSSHTSDSGNISTELFTLHVDESKKLRPVLGDKVAAILIVRRRYRGGPHF